MTHEFLALMLGVRRQTVSAVASDLSRRGLIAYSLGFIEVVDRAGLEDSTCECYEFIRKEFARSGRTAAPTGPQSSGSGHVALGRTEEVVLSACL
jgi:hypothetical protein